MLRTDIYEIMRISDELQDSISKTVKISFGEVLRIVVDDLVEKYKHNVDRNQEWADAFKKVLSYYLTEDEMNERLQ